MKLLCKWRVMTILKLRQSQLKRKAELNPDDREARDDLLLVESIVALLNKKHRANATEL